METWRIEDAEGRMCGYYEASAGADPSAVLSDWRVEAESFEGACACPLWESSALSTFPKAA